MDRAALTAPPRRSLRRARASSPPTSRAARSRSASTPSAWSPPRTTAAAYRQLLFTTPGSGDHISGVILFDETIRQSADDGTPFPQLLESQGDHPRHQGRHRRQAARRRPRARPSPRASTACASAWPSTAHLGARFAKWRATYTITDELPSQYCYDVERARAGSLRGAVPGSRHRADRRARGADGRHAHDRALARSSPRTCSRRCTTRCSRSTCTCPGTLLKPNMVLSGYECPQQASDDEVADMTIARVPVRGAGGGARHRVPVRRPERRAGHRPPQRDEPARPAPVAAVVLVRPRAPGAGAQGVGRRGRQARGRPAARTPSGPASTASPARATTSPRWKTPPDRRRSSRRQRIRLRGTRYARTMRALVQRVTRRSVDVDGEVVGEIGVGAVRARGGDPRRQRGRRAQARRRRCGSCACSPTPTA